MRVWYGVVMLATRWSPAEWRVWNWVSSALEHRGLYPFLRTSPPTKTETKTKTKTKTKT